MPGMLSNVFSASDADPGPQTPNDPLVPDPTPYDNPDTPDDRGGGDNAGTDSSASVGGADSGFDQGAAGGDDFAAA